jgi:membrane protein
MLAYLKRILTKGKYPSLPNYYWRPQVRFMEKKQRFKLVRTAFANWRSDNATLRAAALTFFIILPLPSLLLLVIALFAPFYGQTQAFTQLIQHISAVAGPTVAKLFSQLLGSSNSPFTSVVGTVTVVGFSVGGAIGAFSVLRDTMDVIWKINPPKCFGLMQRIRQKIGPFVLVSALGLIVIAWTTVTTFFYGALRLLPVNGFLTSVLFGVSELVLSFLVSTLLFAIVYKVIPEAKVHWKDVVLGSVIAGLAFTLINYFFGSYIQVFTITTVIGAAGSLMIILLWIFIINEIVLFGAELSQVYASIHGSHRGNLAVTENAARNTKVCPNKDSKTNKDSK